jgi:hypothetical protein
MKCYTGPQTESFRKQSKLRKMDMSFGMSNLDLGGVQVRRVALNQQAHNHFSMERNENHVIISFLFFLYISK